MSASVLTERSENRCAARVQLDTTVHQSLDRTSGTIQHRLWCNTPILNRQLSVASGDGRGPLPDVPHVATATNAARSATSALEPLTVTEELTTGRGAARSDHGRSRNQLGRARALLVWWQLRYADQEVRV